MKLVSASFSNFRLLRDLDVEFSTDTEKNVTVIRAANESGKTTMLTAIQWALYGDNALPNKGTGFRLHPIDWDESEGTRVPITVSVEFERTEFNRKMEMHSSREKYKIVRTVTEDIDSEVSRPTPTIKLFKIDSRGANPISNPESWINEKLPQNLREVFFTDGDRALSFIEADGSQKTKRKKVQDAIRSLLQLEVIKDAIRHLKKTTTDNNREIAKVSDNSELADVLERLSKIEEEIGMLEGERDEASDQMENLDLAINEKDTEIAKSLKAGNKEGLNKEHEKVKNNIANFDEQIKYSIEEHSTLFHQESLALNLLKSVLDPVFEKLEKLHDQGQIPKVSIPVLEERLSSKLCICGESLSPKDNSGAERREKIQLLIEDSRKADENQQTIINLYHTLKSDLASYHESQWIDEYKKIIQQRTWLAKARDEEGKELRDIETKIFQLDDSDIQGLSETLKVYREQRDRMLSKLTESQTRLEGVQKEHQELAITRNKLMKTQDKNSIIVAESQVVSDLNQVLQGAYNQITDIELTKVSNHMNEIFLEMIGADTDLPNIKKAEISPEFDIIVFGSKNRQLDPEKDLNGASRRALTLAFILALTKVSGVEAPNVIDTPLGMASGYVKRSILKKTAQESSQLILFLTHSEIKDCEDIIDRIAGKVITLTNPSHFPKILVNDPKIKDQRIIRCDCDHNSVCDLCKRHAEEVQVNE